eukprot:262762_1
MSLFSPYVMEDEHLIYETQLRIHDIFLPAERKWIGIGWIKALKLYDRIIHGNTIYDKRVLTRKNQSRLLRILQYVMDDRLSEASPSAYTQSLIDALLKKNGTIWINIHQINELRVGLKGMFVTENNELGTYIQYLRHTCNAIKVYP